ncbi:MAG: MgtC/SapB family protein [Lachnospiraceae bacterium]|nr:MgtC/SapB family protein [Lachnospiraceae bacterium]
MFFTNFSTWTPENVILRIIVSVVLGAVIGIDRGAKRRGGGARTTTTVCIGATLVMLMEQYLMQCFPDMADMTRMAAQVVSGVGFLGAGTILVAGRQIKGLTSAAGIWFSACVGLAVGIGFLDGAILVTVILIFVLHLIPGIERRIYAHSRYMTLHMEVEDAKLITFLFHKLKEDGCVIDTYDANKPKAKRLPTVIEAVIHIPKKKNKDDYLMELRDIPGVLSVDDM